MRIVVTGAAGQIGSEIAQELAQSHDLCLIDRRVLAGRNLRIADLSRRRATGRCLAWKSVRWSDWFKGADVVIHLAADPSPVAPWDRVLHHNIEATWCVCEAAAAHQVPRVVFASSNWAVKAVEMKLAPSCYQPAGPKIDSGTPPSPLTPYGLSKAFGELTGRMLVDEHKLKSFLAVRLGAYGAKPLPDARERALWIGIEDTRRLFRRCVEAEFAGFHVVYGVSAQPAAPYDLSYTSRLLSWTPRQSAVHFD